MVAMARTDFVTSEVAKLLRLPEWRVIKFAQGQEYGIRPSIRKASGSGTRRVYDTENVCEFALALRLLETGLRSKAIGKVIRQLRGKVNLSSKLGVREEEASSLYLAIIRAPETGKPLDEKRRQEVRFILGVEEAQDTLKAQPDDDVIFVPIGTLFLDLKHQLRQMESEKGD